MTGPKLVDDKEQVKAMKAEAKEHWDIIVKASGLTSVSSMQIGYHARYMKEKKLFQVLGFENENDAREAAGVGESTWYENIRLAEAFKDVPEKRFVAMKQSNAKALADMPESKRNDTHWLRMAETMKFKDFSAKIDEAMEGRARASDTKEASTSLKISMPASRKKVIEERTKEFAKIHGMEAGDVGKVLEVMSLEMTEGKTLIGSITNAVQRVKLLKEFIKSGASAEEIVTKAEAELDAMVLEFNEALQQASQRQAA